MAENSDEELPNFCIEFNWSSTEANVHNDQTEPARFPQLSEEEMTEIISQKHSSKTKNTTKWGVLTFKGKLFLLILILFFSHLQMKKSLNFNDKLFYICYI